MIELPSDWYDAILDGVPFDVGVRCANGTLWSSIKPSTNLLSLEVEDSTFSIIDYSQDRRYIKLSTPDFMSTFFSPYHHFSNVHPCSSFIYSMDIAEVESIGISGAENGDLRAWDVRSGEPLRTYEGHVGDINHCCLFPSKKVLLSCSSDLSIRIWDLFTGRCARTLNPHRSSIRKVLPVRVGREVVSLERLGMVCVTEVANGCVLWEHHFDSAMDIDVCQSHIVVLTSTSSFFVCIDSHNITEVIHPATFEQPKSIGFIDDETVVVGGRSGILNANIKGETITIRPIDGTITKILFSNNRVFFSITSTVYSLSIEDVTVGNCASLSVFQIPRAHDVFNFSVSKSLWVASNEGISQFNLI
ncbi:hypothetical protein P9112_004662 [Eukaryota sp. TZLM1-RC]